MGYVTTPLPPLKLRGLAQNRYKLIEKLGYRIVFLGSKNQSYTNQYQFGLIYCGLGKVGERRIIMNLKGLDQLIYENRRRTGMVWT